MRTTLKTFWIYMLLMLCYCVNCNAFDFTKVEVNLAEISHASLSTSTDITFNLDSSFDPAKLIGFSDVYLGSKPVTEVYSSSQQRSRRAIEDNLFLKNILQILSNHENSLAMGQTKLYYSDKALCPGLTGNVYYIYTLRRILI